jgi:small-conductance mechanosensitive channel
MLLGWRDPLLPLSLASLLLLAILIDARRDRRRPLWLRFIIRLVTFVILTGLIQLAVGSPIAPHLRAAVPGEQAWERLAEIGWWMMGARVAVGIARLVLVLEDRPRETQIVSDLLAGTIYIAAVFAIVNFVFGVPIGGLLATSGVVAIVLGLALQNTLSDVFSGLAIGLERAYKLGDLLWVEGGIEGQVLQLDWRSTRIATAHNSVAIVPNSVIAKSRLENRSEPTPARGLIVAITVDAGVDPLRSILALDAAVLACGIPLRLPTPTINCARLEGNFLVYEIGLVVGSAAEIATARTEVLTQVYSHLRHAGILLAGSNIVTDSSTSSSTIDALITESDAFGSLSADDQALLAPHFVLVTYERGAALARQGELTKAFFLLKAGTVELAEGEGVARRVLLRASPGDSIGVMDFITGAASPVTATALTPVAAYSLDEPGIATVLRNHPGLASSLEAQAQRGRAWLRCEVPIEGSEEVETPGLLIPRLRRFLRRLEH